MTPSDFPSDSPRLFIPVFDWTRPLLPPASPSLGTSQVPGSTFDTRCSLTPRIVRRLLVPVASSPVLDFALTRRLVTIKTHNEAELDSLVLRLASLFSRIPALRIAPQDRRKTTCQTGNLHGKLLSVFKLSQASLGDSGKMVNF